ncbi:MAG: helix-turn-helix domain-containing protein [Desulfobulbaceae bacterium]|nr:MAG: helix-turn-helix domain-containing protein [Desulfobulbaceae bacterium]
MQTILVSPGDIGAKLRDMRRQQGLSQAELGKRVGLDQKKVSLIENGNPNCRVDSLFRLLSALGAGLVVQPKMGSTPVGQEVW